MDRKEALDFLFNSGKKGVCNFVFGSEHSVGRDLFFGFLDTWRAYGLDIEELTPETAADADYIFLLSNPPTNFFGGKPSPHQLELFDCFRKLKPNIPSVIVLDGVCLDENRFNLDSYISKYKGLEKRGIKNLNNFYNTLRNCIGVVYQTGFESIKTSQPVLFTYEHGLYQAHQNHLRYKDIVLPKKYDTCYLGFDKQDRI